MVGTMEILLIILWGCRLSERIPQQKRQRFVAANEGAEPLQLHHFNKGTYSKYKGNLYVVGSSPTPRAIFSQIDQWVDQKK